MFERLYYLLQMCKFDVFYIFMHKTSLTRRVSRNFAACMGLLKRNMLDWPRNMMSPDQIHNIKFKKIIFYNLKQNRTIKTMKNERYQQHFECFSYFQLPIIPKMDSDVIKNVGLTAKLSLSLFLYSLKLTTVNLLILVAI